jgi:ADP-ribose pyrophosphatase YjhB (NUDIX family)
MEIKTKIKTQSAGEFDVIYKDVDSITELNGVHIHHVAAYAFCDGKLVIVRDGVKDTWTPAGGGVEESETIEQAVEREVMEESNMRVLCQHIIGYQAISEAHRITNQTRSFCIVEPYGPFISDPDGDIVEIKLIDPTDYKEYFDWGVVGDHVMKKALNYLVEYKAKKKTGDM